MAAGRKKNTETSAYEWVQTVVCTVLAAVLLCTFAVRPIRVDGPSMRETLQNGDQLLVLNGWFCGEYRAGDIVIFSRPDFEGGSEIVKRVVATAGQTVDIDFTSGSVYVDGALLEEPYLREPTLLEEGTAFPLTVPEGCLFVMGDNRNNSKDSRSRELGPVDSRSVIGRALFLAIPGVTAETERRDWSRVGNLT